MDFRAKFYELPEQPSYEIVICNLFEFGRVQTLLFGKGLNLSATYTKTLLILSILQPN